MDKISKQVSYNTDVPGRELHLNNSKLIYSWTHKNSELTIYLISREQHLNTKH